MSRRVTRKVAPGIVALAWVSLSACGGAGAPAQRPPFSTTSVTDPLPVSGVPSGSGSRFHVGCPASASGGSMSACEVVLAYLHALTERDQSAASRVIARGNAQEFEAMRWWLDHLVSLEDVVVVRAVSTSRLAEVKVLSRSYVDEAVAGRPNGLRDWFFSLHRSPPDGPWRIDAEGSAP